VCTVTAPHQSAAPTRHERPGAAVYRSVVLDKLLYASSAWWGFTTANDRHRIEAVVHRRVRAGLYPADGPAAAQLVEYNDDTLFSRPLSLEQHVLPKAIMTIIFDPATHSSPFAHHGPPSLHTQAAFQKIDRIIQHVRLQPMLHYTIIVCAVPHQNAIRTMTNNIIQ